MWFKSFVEKTLADLLHLNSQVISINQYLQRRGVQIYQNTTALRSIHSNQFTNEKQTFSIKVYESPIDILQSEVTIIQDYDIL